MNGLAFLHLELTSRCQKSCWMCGRRKIEKQYPHMVDWGDMPFEMVVDIERQLPRGIVVQFHNNGEPLLYPHLGAVLRVFGDKYIKCFNTNAKLLLEKADDIIGHLETLTISVVQDDPEQEEQYEIVSKFIERKGSRPPNLIYRLLGRIDNKERWQRLPGIVATRILHAAGGSFDYEKKVTIPEIGICWDLLTHLAIDRYGNASLCVRFDPEGHGRLGNVANRSLKELWYGEKRRENIKLHIKGERKGANPLCAKCDYWGVPRGE